MWIAELLSLTNKSRYFLRAALAFFCSHLRAESTMALINKIASSSELSQQAVTSLHKIWGAFGAGIVDTAAPQFANLSASFNHLHGR